MHDPELSQILPRLSPEAEQLASRYVGMRLYEAEWGTPEQVDIGEEAFRQFLASTIR